MSETVEAMTLRQIQAELRAISGTPYRDADDRLRRQALWCRIDAMVRAIDRNTARPKRLAR
jgi:hypothetical protein